MSETGGAGKGCLIFIGIFLGLTMLVGLCSTGNDEDSAGDGRSSNEDIAAELACGRMRSVAREVVAGVVTPTELREELQEIRQTASVGSPELQAATTAMLAAATQGDTGGLADALDQMNTTCTAAGH